MKAFFFLFFLPLLLCSCQREDLSPQKKSSFVEMIQREEGDFSFSSPPPPTPSPPTYPWEETTSTRLPRITKECFRCRGRWDHPLREEVCAGEQIYRSDCGGHEQHSLPLREGEECIYPILLDLLNYLQEETQRRVHVLAGHRCPDHQMYIDASPQGRIAKHMIGAEVAFFVEGYEEKPEEIVTRLHSFYRNQPTAFTQFLRYEKENTNVRTFPWYNKEIFIKLFLPDEGRNPEITITHPYLSVQVRWDRETEKQVIYDGNMARKNYYRW